MGLLGKKKLKKIPYDLVSYIQIEAEAIKDANDKQMISSYCLKYLEDVNWYLDLIEAGSEKYIVPHTKAQLERIRDQLMAAHKAIMATKIPDPKRPIIDIKNLSINSEKWYTGRGEKRWRKRDTNHGAYPMNYGKR